jgi:hypothetical protein
VDAARRSVMCELLICFAIALIAISSLVPRGVKMGCTELDCLEERIWDLPNSTAHTKPKEGTEPPYKRRRYA